MAGFRPITDLKKLAMRVALFALAGVILSNAFFWFPPYFEIFGRRTDYLSAQTLKETVMVFGISTAFWSIVLVPLAFIVVTPLIRLTTGYLLRWLEKGVAFACAVVLATIGFLALLWVCTWLLLVLVLG